jgi:hypothetical protein
MAWKDVPAEMRQEGIISSSVLLDGGGGKRVYPVFNRTLAFALQWRKLTANLREQFNVQETIVNPAVPPLVALTDLLPLGHH